MRDEVLTHLHAIVHEALAIKQFVTGHTLESYCTHELLRSAVERKFEIIGEALNRIHRDDPDMLARIRNYRDIISFRNILIHGYDVVDNRIVWGVIEEDLDDLIEDATNLVG